MLSVVLMVAAMAADLQKFDVFRAGEDGYTAYRIPGVVVTKKGTLIAYAEARKKSYRDWGAIDIGVKRSTDGGRTWSAMAMPAKVEGTLSQNPVNAALKIAEPGDITYNNPVMIPDRDGSLHFLFCVEYMRLFYMRSTDDGVTWTKPVEITGAVDSFRPQVSWKAMATGPGHGIQTRRGRLIVPVWLSLGTGSNGHGDAVSSVIYSDDRGRTWRAGEIAFPATAEMPSPNETAAVELPDGRVMLNARNDAKRNRRLVSISKDGARGWSKPQYDEALMDPKCMASLARHPKGILFSNAYAMKRENVSVHFSADAGRTWPVRRTVEAGWSGYSDLAVGADGAIYCFYEHGDPAADRFRPVALKMARFDLDWLKGGR